MISLAGKAAIITGGSRGIGAAAVKMFAQAGADVVFTYNKAKDAAKLVEQDAGKHGTRVEAFKADVSRHEYGAMAVRRGPCLAAHPPPPVGVSGMTSSPDHPAIGLDA